MTNRTCAGCGTDLSKSNGAIKRCAPCCEEVMRTAGLEPLEPYPGAHKPWRCRCLRCNEIVRPNYAHIQHRGGGGCDSCGRRAAAAGRRLSDAAATAVMLTAGLEPLVPYPGSAEPWKSRCTKCNETVYPRYNDIQQGQGCKSCGVTARTALRRTPEDEAVALARAAGLEPLEPFRSVNQPWRCRCLTCNEITSPQLGSLRRGSAGCGFCSGHFARPDEAWATMRAAGLEPLESYPGSGAQWESRCLKCERTIRPTYWNVKAGHGCRWCAGSGFKTHEAAIIYLATHDGYDAAKIGIGDATRGRLKKHRGWQFVLVLDVPGEVAMAVESDILEWWRSDLRLPIHLGRPEMPQGGWTETVAASEISLGETIRRIRALVARLLPEAKAS